MELCSPFARMLVVYDPHHESREKSCVRLHSRTRKEANFLHQTSRQLIPRVFPPIMQVVLCFRWDLAGGMMHGNDRPFVRTHQCNTTLKHVCCHERQNQLGAQITATVISNFDEYVFYSHSSNWPRNCNSLSTTTRTRVTCTVFGSSRFRQKTTSRSYYFWDPDLYNNGLADAEAK